MSGKKTCIVDGQPASRQAFMHKVKEIASDSKSFSVDGKIVTKNQFIATCAVSSLLKKECTVTNNKKNKVQPMPLILFSLTFENRSPFNYFHVKL